MNDDRNDIMQALIIRHLTGEASAEEEKQLSAWIAQSQDNEHHYRDLRKAFELSNRYYTNRSDQDPDINIDKEWNHFVNQINEKPTADTPVRMLIPDQSPGRWLRVAAALALLVASGFVINYFIFGSRVHHQTTGNTLSITLNDGSEVLLNRNSELWYSTRFGSKTRTVNLKGEAFFEVVRDPDRPFIVHVNDVDIEVLGTSFNVQGYDEKGVDVIVETGVVKFSAPAVNKEVKLTAGQRGVYIKEQQQLISISNEDRNFLSWKTRKIIFIENDLRTVVAALNKAYNANIVITANIPASCVVTVTFDHQSLEAVLNVLKSTLNLTYRITGNQIEITLAGC